jgi:hypothetical protein
MSRTPMIIGKRRQAREGQKREPDPSSRRYEQKSDDKTIKSGADVAVGDVERGRAKGAPATPSQPSAKMGQVNRPTKQL